MGRKPPKGGPKRIPPPPVVRPEVTIERVDTDRSANGPSRSRTRRVSPSIDVRAVDFGGAKPETAAKCRRRLEEAAVAFEREQFNEAERLLASIDKLVPDVPEVLELQGLTAYRLGRWKRAIARLEAFEAATRSVEQHPVLADCHRALGRWNRVEELWAELGAASPSPELVEEGRIVWAGTLADRGRVTDGIRVLEKAPRPSRKPKIHHLRRWYALADLYERAGDLARARRLFSEVASLDPGFGDAAQRARNLG